jgi:hypothetical protein
MKIKTTDWGFYHEETFEGDHIDRYESDDVAVSDYRICGPSVNDYDRRGNESIV